VTPESAFWRKSSYSGGSNSDCVEVAPLVASVGVRDSKARGAGQLTVRRAAWTRFVHGATRR